MTLKGLSLDYIYKRIVYNEIYTMCLLREVMLHSGLSEERMGDLKYEAKLFTEAQMKSIGLEGE